jgi:AcrR family transcriptional regulator
VTARLRCPPDEPATTTDTLVAVRRDVIRNRAKLLAAADDLVRQQGGAATVEEIARHAGVGIGTAYRHFTNKQALLEALFAGRIQQVVALLDEASQIDDPGEALQRFIWKVAEMQATDRGLREALSTIDGFDVRASSRDDIPLLYWIVGSVADYAGTIQPELWRRYLELLLDGIRPPNHPRGPLPAPALSGDEIEAAMLALSRGSHIAAKRKA